MSEFGKKERNERENESVSRKGLSFREEERKNVK